jgi:acetyl-CoA C-acetyltransferase
MRGGEVKNAVILAGARTPIGSFLGSLQSLKATDLGSKAIEHAIKKAKIAPEDVDEVILGQVLQGGVGQAPARQASLGAKIKSNVPATTVNKVCGSGLKAVMMAKNAILLNESKIVVAGGMESMSNAPYFLKNARSGFRMGDQSVVDLMLHDGLLDPYTGRLMGSFGDICAKEFSFSREEQDAYAHESYRRAKSAQERGDFADEIVPITVLNKGVKSEVIMDEEPSRYQPDKMPKLKPSFDPDGTITVANASKINDGAAALIIACEDEAKKRGLKGKARIIAQATFAHDPEWFTTAPIHAIKMVLNNASLTASQIDLYEINEAFSVVAMAAIRELSLSPDRVNVFGGAVALGHPIGCSGARLLVTLLNALEKKKLHLGCVALCLGGGEAVAMIVEKI